MQQPVVEEWMKEFPDGTKFIKESGTNAGIEFQRIGSALVPTSKTHTTTNQNVLQLKSQPQKFQPLNKQVKSFEPVTKGLAIVGGILGVGLVAGLAGYFLSKDNDQESNKPKPSRGLAYSDLNTY